MRGDKEFQVVTTIPFSAVAAQFKHGSWSVPDPVQNVKDLVDEIDNTTSLYIMARECLMKLRDRYEADDKNYSAKAIERTFDESETSASALKGLSTRAENGRTKSEAMRKIIRLINLVESGRQGDVNSIQGL